MNDNQAYRRNYSTQAIENGTNAYVPVVNVENILNVTIPLSKLVNIAVEKMHADINSSMSDKDIKNSFLFSTNLSDNGAMLTSYTDSKKPENDISQTQKIIKSSLSPKPMNDLDSTNDINSQTNDYVLDAYSTTFTNPFESNSDTEIDPPTWETPTEITLDVDSYNNENTTSYTVDQNRIVDETFKEETLIITPIPNFILNNLITKNITNKDEITISPTTIVLADEENLGLSQEDMVGFTHPQDDTLPNTNSSFQGPTFFPEFTDPTIHSQNVFENVSASFLESTEKSLPITTTNPIHLENQLKKYKVVAKNVTGASIPEGHSSNSSISLSKTNLTNHSTNISKTIYFDQPKKTKDILHINLHPKNTSQNSIMEDIRTASTKIQIDLSSTVVLSVSISCALALLVFVLLSLWLLKRQKHHSKVYLSYELAKPRTHITKPMKPCILPGETVLDKSSICGSERPSLPLCFEQELNCSPKIIHSKHSVSVESCDSGIDNLAFTDSSSAEGYARSNRALKQNEINPKRIRPAPKYNARRRKLLDSSIKVYSSDGSIFPASASLTKCFIPPPPYSPSMRNKDMKFSLSLPTISSSKESITSGNLGIENLTSQSSTS